MKYLRQFFVIMVVSFLGEVCHTLLPWPIPASIYGMAILFSALQAGLLRLEQVQDVSDNTLVIVVQENVQQATVLTKMTFKKIANQ